MALPPVGNITLEVTHRCHRRCTFCYLPELSAPDADTSSELGATELVTAARKVMGATGCRRIQMSGGEPLLRGDLVAIVRALVNDGADVSILTDGAHLDSKLAASLAAAGVRAVQPTLLSANPEVHDALRGKGAFRDVTRAIAVAASAGLRVSVCMVVTRQNYRDAGGVAELAFALGAHGLALSRFCPTGQAANAFSSLMPDADHVCEAAQAAAEACRKVGLPLAAAVTIPRCVWPDPAHPPLRVGVCSLVGPKATVTMGPDGAVRSCSLSEHAVGNLMHESWDVLAQRLWEQELEPLCSTVIDACRGCTWLDRCLGGCRMSALATFGVATDADPPARAVRQGTAARVAATRAATASAQPT